MSENQGWYNRGFLGFTMAGTASQVDDAARRLLAGGTSGIVTKTMTAPLERVKILLQLRSMSKATVSSSSSILGTIRSVLKDDGVRGFWKGNGANCIRVVPVYGLKVREFLVLRLLKISCMYTVVAWMEYANE